jgi:hypothetical protein
VVEQNYAALGIAFPALWARRVAPADENRPIREVEKINLFNDGAIRITSPQQPSHPENFG